MNCSYGGTSKSHNKINNQRQSQTFLLVVETMVIKGGGKSCKNFRQISQVSQSWFFGEAVSEPWSLLQGLESVRFVEKNSGLIVP